MKVVVLGSGICGITSAYFLAKAGCEVVVLDRKPESGLGSSYANGGQLSFSHAESWSSKSSLLLILKAFFKPNSFLSISDLRNKNFLKWASGFIGNSFDEKSKIITQRLLSLGVLSKENLESIVANEKIDFNYKAEGILHFYQNQKIFDQAIKQAEIQKKIGCDLEILDARQSVKKESGLVKLFDSQRLEGGIFFPQDASGDSLIFLRKLEAICRDKLGVVFRYNSEIKNLLTNGKKITGINTSNTKGNEVFTANNYIFSLGAFGNNLLAGLGINPQIYPVKGYSLSIPTNEQFISPSLALTDPENKIVYSKLGNIFRVAGTIEICNLKSGINQKHIDFLKNTARLTFSDFGDINNATEWYSFRPYRPDSLPLVCRVQKYGNLFMNCGHGSLGWTNAFATSRIVTNLILHQENHSDFNFFEEMEKSIYQ